MSTALTALVALALFVFGFVAGAAALLAYLSSNARKSIHRVMSIPLDARKVGDVSGSTEEGVKKLEIDVEGMDRIEVMALIQATQYFVDALRAEFDIYEPTESEQAIADMIEEDREEWAKALELSSENEPAE